WGRRRPPSRPTPRDRRPTAARPGPGPAPGARPHGELQPEPPRGGADVPARRSRREGCACPAEPTGSGQRPRTAAPLPSTTSPGPAGGGDPSGVPSAMSEPQDAANESCADAHRKVRVSVAEGRLDLVGRAGLGEQEAEVAV